MNWIQTYLRLRIKATRLLGTRREADLAFELFQTVRQLPPRERELGLYHEAKLFRVSRPESDIPGYELGNPQGETVILVHGWESHAGSMYGIASHLAGKGYRVLCLDLPAHGKHAGKRTNLLECKEALKVFMNQLDRPFHVVSHSFGSAVTSLALSELKVQALQLVFLTSPNEITDIFREFQRFVGLSEKAYQLVVSRAEGLLKSPLEEASVARRLSAARFEALTLLHDKHDQILPFSNSAAIQQQHPQAELIELDQVGHYRMLWNPAVYALVSQSLESVGVEK
ncbi:MAG: alpha/beta fold hydrolase [Flavobacteriales bacterium]|nr:alpha/beta fold hydrolase [Flavobacteriales bacterium]